MRYACVPETETSTSALPSSPFKPFSSQVGTHHLNSRLSLSLRLFSSIVPSFLIHETASNTTSWHPQILLLILVWMLLQKTCKYPLSYQQRKSRINLKSKITTETSTPTHKEIKLYFAYGCNTRSIRRSNDAPTQITTGSKPRGSRGVPSMNEDMLMSFRWVVMWTGWRMRKKGEKDMGFPVAPRRAK